MLLDFRVRQGSFVCTVSVLLCNNGWFIPTRGIQLPYYLLSSMKEFIRPSNRDLKRQSKSPVEVPWHVMSCPHKFVLMQKAFTPQSQKFMASSIAITTVPSKISSRSQFCKIRFIFTFYTSSHHCTVTLVQKLRLVCAHKFVTLSIQKQTLHQLTITYTSYNIMATQVIVPSSAFHNTNTINFDLLSDANNIVNDLQGSTPGMITIYNNQSTMPSFSIQSRKIPRQCSTDSTLSQRSISSSARPRARFPMKLRTVLNDALLENNEHIISWLPHGKAFKVHKPDLFASQIMRRYFRQSHFRSFTRQVSLYPATSNGRPLHFCFWIGRVTH